MKNFIILTSMIFAMSAIQVSAADNKSKKDRPAPTAEEREKMAATHEKMAQCLRSDKPMKDCHEEMAKACKENMGGKGCMMGHGKHMHGED